MLFKVWFTTHKEAGVHEGQPRLCHPLLNNTRTPLAANAGVVKNYQLSTQQPQGAKHLKAHGP